MHKRRVLGSMAAAVIASGVGVVAFSAPAFALPHATGTITCTMTSTSTSGLGVGSGQVKHGLSSGGPFYSSVAVKFKATFACTPNPAVVTPTGDLVTGGTLKGAAKYTAVSSSNPANSCVDFNGVDLLAAAAVKIKWTTTGSPIADTVIKYTNIGPGTVAGGVITLAGDPPGTVTKAGSFAAPNPPNTVQLVTNLPPVTACPAVTAPHLAFQISSGTIIV
jgi:hypothetical protein